MEIDISKVELSLNDQKIGLILPNKTSEELAEFIGILAGDGYVSFTRKENIISICGDSELDYQYLGYVKSLIKKIFNIKVEIKQKKNQKLAFVSFSSKGVLNYLRSIGYYKHNSRKITIPYWILHNKEYHKCLVKDLADTDFSLMLYKNRKKYPHYPVISLTSADTNFIKLISKILSNLNFNVNIILNDIRYDKRSGKIRSESRLRLSGRENLALWMKVTGFRNKRHINKYTEYRKSGLIIKRIGRPSLKIKNGDAGTFNPEGN